jgi:predicted PurR-regulated permease PerM
MSALVDRGGMEVPGSKSRLSWWAVGLALGVLLLFVAYSFIGTLVLAVFVYYGTRPFYRRLRSRLPSRSAAASLALLSLGLPVVLLVTYAIAIGLQEFGRFRRTADLGPLEDALGPYLGISDVVDDPGTLLSDPSARRTLESALGPALDSLGFIGTGLLHLFVVFAAAFYMLKDGGRLSRWVRRQFGDGDGVLVTFIDRVDADLHSVFTGNLLNAVFTAGIGAVVYSLLDFVAPATPGIPYPALVGLLAGAASLVPVVGMKLVYVPMAAYLFGIAYLAGTPVWFPVAFTAASFVIVDTIPDLLLRPYVSGRNLHVGLVMFAYIFGPLLFGWYGIFLGPLLLVFIYHFAQLVLPELVSGVPVRSSAYDPGVGDPAATDPEPTAPATAGAEPSADGGETGVADEGDGPTDPTGDDGGTRDGASDGTHPDRGTPSDGG